MPHRTILFAVTAALLAVGVAFGLSEGAQKAGDPPVTRILTTYSPDVPAEARVDFETAARIWERCLVTPAPIHIHLTWIPRGPTGFATMNGARNQPHLPVADVWYPTALSHALAGTRLNPADDMNIFLSARTNWYYSSDAPIAEDETDFINVAMHEIAHGLGISSASFVPWQGEPIGALGLPNEWVNYFDYTFETPELDGTPTLYDSFIRLADGRTLRDFDNPSLELTYALANPTIHFEGTAARAANRGFPVGVTPLNISHIPAFPRAPNPIMLSDSGQGESIHAPDAVLLGMLRDLGWEIAEACGNLGQAVVGRGGT
ncbi:MAG: hypothetical protein AAF829_04790 [Pseudomonadota bacterium]